MAEQIPFDEVGLALNPEPRCPCVLLIDVSASMAGVVPGSGGVSRIDLVNDGLRAYQADLVADPLAAQRVEVAVITFGGTVQTVVPFVSAQEFAPPTLAARGKTPLGAAVVHALDAVEDRKALYRANALHYYRPWVFLITDGGPTDDWQEAAARVRAGEAGKQFALFAVGVEGADFRVLRDLSARAPLPLKGYNFREMFMWLSVSQRRVSQSTPGEEGGVKLPSPAGWTTL